MRWVALFSLLLVVAWPARMACAAGTEAAAGSGTVRLAVLAFRPKPEVAAKWQPLIDYLNKSIAGRRFVIEVLNYGEFEDAVAAKRVDVVLTQPAHYILLTYRDGLLSPLASLVERAGTHRLTRFGGVVLARSERRDLESLADVRGKRIATSQVDSLGSYQMQALELKRQGILLPDDASVIETGQPQDRAIEAVLAGQADVAFVRTGVLEALVRKGTLTPDQLKVIHPVKSPGGFPYALSTRLYPEWPLAVMPWMDEELARRLAAAVLGLPHDGEVAQQIGITGFTIPLDYKPVDELLRELRLPPFDGVPEITLQDVVRRYPLPLLLFALALLGLAFGVSLALFRNNRRLRRDKDKIGRMMDELDRYRHHLEAMVAQRTDELAQAKQLAEAANRAKGFFLANMSHEIRTPLNAIIGLTHIIQRANRDDEQAGRLRKVDGAAAHLLSILNDILDLSKIEAGKMVLEDIDFLLSSVLDSICSLVSHQARAKGLRLFIDPGDVPVWLRGDPLRLRQALINYSSNALKFTEQGSISLHARRLADDGETLEVRFEVVDTGPGIAADKCSRLFENFEQTDAGIARQHGGTGLGLAITRHLAELMGGRAGVESQPGKGSCFWFTARLRHGRGRAPQPAQRSERPDLELAARYRGARLLLVDDNAVNREVAIELLGECGLVVEVAGDGQEAVDKARATPYDLILMDMHMPKMGGLEATRALRALPDWQDKPILALTANAFDDDRRACRAAGMDDFIAKPVIPDTLYRVLLKWLPASTAAVTPAGPEPVAVADPAGIAGADGDAHVQDARLRAIPGLDFERGLAMARGNPGKLAQLLSLFLQRHGEDDGKVLAALAADDRETLKQLAHALKGSAGNVGLVRLGELASALDSGLNARAPADQLERHARVLATELARLLEQAAWLR